MVQFSRFLVLIMHIMVVLESVYSGGMVRICYFNAVARYREAAVRFDTQNIDFNLCTHYVYAYAKINADCMSLYPIELSEESPYGAYQDFTGLNLRERRTVKTLLSIGGPNDTERRELAKLTHLSEYRMEIFTASVLDVLLYNGFDGLDIDVAYPPEFNTTAGFSRLLRILKSFFYYETPESTKHFLLTVKVPADYSQVSNAFNAAAVSRYADYITVATYDLPSPNPNEAWFGSACCNPTYPSHISVNSALDMWLKAGLIADKTVCGITPVGRYYRLRDPSKYKPGSPITSESLSGKYFNIPNGLPYYEICEMFKTGSRYYYNEGGMYYMVVGDTWVGYDDNPSLFGKAIMTHSRGLAGVMFSAIDMDDFNGHCEYGTYILLNFIKKGTDTIRPPTPLVHSFFNKANAGMYSHVVIIIMLCHLNLLY